MREIKGDLFTSSDNLCHCVSADMVMDAGIAIGFRERWGRPIGNFSIGDIVVIPDGNRKIIYLVTKNRYNHKPTYQSLEQCLHKIRDMNLISLSMPRIGCGLDRLNWSKVSEMVSTILSNTDVTVYSL